MKIFLFTLFVIIMGYVSAEIPYEIKEIDNHPYGLGYTNTAFLVQDLSRIDEPQLKETKIVWDKLFQGDKEDGLDWGVCMRKEEIINEERILDIVNITLLDHVRNKPLAKTADGKLKTIFYLRPPSYAFLEGNPKAFVLGMNAERIALMEGILFAMATGRTLVEPFINAITRNSTAYELDFKRNIDSKDYMIGQKIYRFSELFDISRLENILGRKVMLLEDYHNLILGEIEELKVFHQFKNHIQKEFLLIDRYWTVEKFSYTLYNQKDGKTIPQAPLWNEEEYYNRLDSKPEDEHIVAYTAREMFTQTPLYWHKNYQQLYWPIRAAMKFHSKWYKQANAIMKKMGLLNEEYVAVQWRRGDRGNWEMGERGKLHMNATNPLEVGKAVSLFAHKYNVQNIFVAHNVGIEKDFQYMVNVVYHLLPTSKIYKLPPYLAYPEAKDHNGNMILEMIICSFAKGFLADGLHFGGGSMFSTLVTEEALINGRSLKTSYILDLIYSIRRWEDSENQKAEEQHTNTEDNNRQPSVNLQNNMKDLHYHNAKQIIQIPSSSVASKDMEAEEIIL